MQGRYSMAMIKVGIVGLGLMGGSLSLALKKHSADYYFIGLDHNELHCKEHTCSFKHLNQTNGTELAKSF